LQPRPKLPVSARGRFVERPDGVAVGILGLNFIKLFWYQQDFLIETFGRELCAETVA
jgi:hypothetical protein